jgi:hypothetical protein
MTPSMAEKANHLVQRNRSDFGFRVAPCEAEKSEEALRSIPRMRRGYTARCNHIKSKGLEAYRSDSKVESSWNRQSGARKEKILGDSRYLAGAIHGTSIALYASNVMFEL